MLTRERLKSHLKRTATKQVDFARLVGVTRVALSFILSGRRSPGRDLALDIELATGGRIKARDWSKDAPRRAA